MNECLRFLDFTSTRLELLEPFLILVVTLLIHRLLLIIVVPDPLHVGYYFWSSMSSSCVRTLFYKPKTILKWPCLFVFFSPLHSSGPFRGKPWGDLSPALRASRSRSYVAPWLLQCSYPNTSSPYWTQCNAYSGARTERSSRRTTQTRRCLCHACSQTK